MSKNVAEYFACDVFNDEVMKARLPKAVYKALTRPESWVCRWIRLMLMSLQMH